MPFEADMHSHSYYSDGYNSPAELVKTAKSQGLKAICLTDHDNFNGIHEFIRACKLARLDFIHAIELTTTYKGVIVHILGYGLDLNNHTLNKVVFSQWYVHNLRMTQILRKYRKKKVMDVSLDNLKRSVQCKGPCMFDTWLIDFRMRMAEISFEQAKNEISGNGFVNTEYDSELLLTAPQAVDLIDNAGGLAVIAHPGEIRRRLENRGIHVNWNNFIQLCISILENQGLAGIEVSHPRNDDEQTEFLTHLADQRGLIKFGGSDYHGKFKSYLPGQCGISYKAFQQIKAKIIKKRPRKS